MISKDNSERIKNKNFIFYNREQFWFLVYRKTVKQRGHYRCFELVTSFASMVPSIPIKFASGCHK